MATNALAAGVAPGIISEKTVELNLSIEIANFLYSRHGRPAFAWGPTLRQEARWGFDAAYGINGRFIYVQFKRAHDEAPGHRFELNRTANRDQHRKLQLLEASGVAVRYGLPRFTSLQHIQNYRRGLLVPPHTAWIRPSRITMPNGGVGHHDLHVHPSRRWLASEPVELGAEDENPFLGDLGQFTSFEDGDAERWAAVFEKVFGEDDEATAGAAIILVPT